MYSGICPCYGYKFEKILVKGTVFDDEIKFFQMYLLIHLASIGVVTYVVARKITTAINTIFAPISGVEYIPIVNI